MGKIIEQNTDEENTEIEVLPPTPKAEEVDIDIPMEMRIKLTDAVRKDWSEIVSGLAELAKGVWVKDYVKDKNGNLVKDNLGRPTTKTYLKPPDREAARYLVDQVVGKPKENLVVQGKVNFLLDL